MKLSTHSITRTSLSARSRRQARPLKALVAFGGLMLGLIVVLGGSPARAQAPAAYNVPIIGEINRLTLNNAADVWSGGTIVVGGQNVILPRNLLIDLPANRLTLQQIFAQAPPGCVTRGESGLAKADRCNTRGGAGIASITAIRTAGGNVIAADVFFQKGIDAVSGIVTFIDRTNGYLRLNGNPNDPNTGVMVRLNDPTGRHTVQQGPGCIDGSPNCSPDPRFTEDPDNYTQAFGTGYPVCIPSTVARQFVDTLDLNNNGNKTEILTAQSAPDGSSDLLCPATNRSTPGAASLLVNSAIQLVDDSRRLAPILVGDHITAKGNFETVNNVYFLSAFSTTVSGRLETKDAPGQPDYMTISELFVETPGFQAQRMRSTVIGTTSLDSTGASGALGSDVLLWSIHRDPSTNVAHEFPFGSIRGCDNAAGRGRCTTNEGAPNSFRLKYIIGFLPPAPFARKPEDSACNVVRAEPRFNIPGKTLCPSVDSFGAASLEDEFGIFSPLMHEMQARTGRKLDDLLANGGQTTLLTIDLHGNDAPNGQYLFPMGINLGGISPPEMAELNPGLLGVPFNVSGFPWNLDRRLGPNGCLGRCESVSQPLDPFPFEGVDPRTQAANVLFANAGLPTGQYLDMNFTRSSLSNASNRILSYIDPVFGIFDGDNTLLAWPPLDPPVMSITPTNVYTSATAADSIAPTAPAGLTATPASATGINLSWAAATDNIGVSSYLVFRDGITLPLATVFGTSFSVGGLAPQTTHTFTVMAMDAAGNLSAASNTALATTLADTTPPSAPGGLLATATGPTAINLTWTASTDNVRVAGYRIFRDGGTTPAATVTGTAFSDSTLTSGTTHSYTVAAVDAAGNQSALSNKATATTTTGTPPPPVDTIAPSVPTGLFATGISASQITITWNASTDNFAVTGYKVFRDGFTTAVATVTTGTSFTDSLLLSSTTHSYTVQAFDAAGNVSGQSAPASATTLAQGLITLLVLNPTTAQAGLQPFPVGTVTISNFAPALGTVVNLSSSAPGFATVPATVVVPPGQRTTSFTITTTAGIGVQTTVAITATINGAGQSAILNLTP